MKIRLFILCQLTNCLRTYLQTYICIYGHTHKCLYIYILKIPQSSAICTYNYAHIHFELITYMYRVHTCIYKLLYYSVININLLHCSQIPNMMYFKYINVSINLTNQCGAHLDNFSLFSKNSSLCNINIVYLLHVLHKWAQTNTESIRF